MFFIIVTTFIITIFSQVRITILFHCTVCACIELNCTGQLGDRGGFAWWSFQCSGAREAGWLLAEEEKVANERLAQGM